MTTHDTLEQRISERLHGHSRLAPDRDGWEAILDRIEHRGRARTRRRVATTGLVLAGIVGSLVVLAGHDGTRVSTIPPAAPARTPAGGLSHLVLGDLSGFQVTSASGSEADGTSPDLGQLLVYALPGDEGLLGPGPALFVRLVPAGAPYGIGDGPDAQATDVDGRPGRLLARGPGRSLGWPREDGSLVHLVELGIADGDLLAAGRAIEGALALGQAPPADLPGGVELRRATPSETAASASSEIRYQAGARSVSLRISGGGANRLDSLLLDRLASSSGWRPATVDGRPAVQSTYQQPDDTVAVGRTLMWAPDPGMVAELVSQGLTADELEAAAASVHPVDDATWEQLLARFTVTTPVPSTGAAAGDDPIASVTTEMCQARNRWLRARAVGDADLEAAAVADLGAVLEKGQAAGLGATGDVLVVVRRLLDAIAAGDDAAVSSIPESGACS